MSGYSYGEGMKVNVFNAEAKNDLNMTTLSPFAKVGAIRREIFNFFANRAIEGSVTLSEAGSQPLCVPPPTGYAPAQLLSEMVRITSAYTASRHIRLCENQMRVRNHTDVRRLYEKEKQRYAKETHILTIQECPVEDFLLTSKERLEKYGFGDYTTVELTTDVVDTSRAAEFDENNIAGRAVPVKGPDGFRTAVFLRECFENCPGEMVHWVTKLGVLYHELGHAWEHKVGVHTNLQQGTSNLQRAEEYADEFARMRLSRVKCEFSSTEGELTNLWDLFDLYRHKGTYRRELGDHKPGEGQADASSPPQAKPIQ
jgi:hypothetical protein